ncbi:eye-specific diacylglycerol kinase [Euwallacea similis]|uniref:eye-specific diacylglycerol kinase n=1 Tax=Euwallacea similis TaxID=1736056 RepID=UPI0034501F6C
MQRLRTTFKRSRTPTGAEMKMQSSLEVPKQIRSASFDEIQLETKRLQDAGCAGESQGFLGVPHIDQRSRSVDSGGSEESGNFLEVPSRRFQRRRSSGSKGTICIHCICKEEHERLHPPEELPPGPPEWLPCLSDSSSDDDEDSDDDDEINNSRDTTTEYSRNTTNCSLDTTTDYSRENSADYSKGTDNSRENSVDPPEFVLTVTLLPSQTISSPPPIPSSPVIEFFPPEPESEAPLTPTQSRRKSIHRQEAFFAEPTGTSLENMSDAPSEAYSEGTSEGAQSEGDMPHTTIPGLVVSDIYLQVPDLKRDRAASVDSCFSKVPEKKTEELQHSGMSLEVPVGPNVALRSRSVDIVLPTDEQARYKALAMTAPPAASSLTNRRSTGPAERLHKGTPDWSESATIGDHLWVSTAVSVEFCYVGDAECLKHGGRFKCSACNIVCHEDCVSILMDRQRFTCKPSFRDVGVRQYREQTTIQHHWVHRRSEKGKCQQCAKSFQSKLSFSSKEIVAICCSWCKVAYHNKESCFNIQRIGEECNLGVHNNIIVPPSWIVKLPRKGSFKSSLRKVPKKKGSNKRRVSNKDKEYRTFVIKPIPSTTVTPVIVFINPKSGGNQGLKLMQKFQWLLNPRQVFDLTQGGPKFGLELFRKVPNLRVLACGGDGTVGWVLSVIDQIKMKPAPPVGVLPLGTGNDLARALGWGGGYTDEPISKILTNINHSDTVLLDRWCLDVETNPNTEQNNDGKDTLPLSVVNNYYSLGVDAHIALEFHEAREAHPEKFNSRLRNKMFYGQMGGKDLLRRKWKGLADYVTLECDGNDITPKLKELRVHAIVFLNIASYGGGTKPWSKTMGTSDPSTEDGLIEVLGLTTYQLPLLQAGGHGTCITQCRSAKIVTTKTIPMQVDGEACKLKPSIISISHLNKATMLAKRKSGKVIPPQAALQNLKYTVHKISMPDYEQHHYDKDKLTEAAINIGSLEIIITSDLEQARTLINRLLEEKKDPVNSSEWCFVDSCTAERFFRIDRAQENLHYVMDIASENLYILECGGGTVPQTPEDETANPSPSSNHKTSLVIPEMRISDEGSLDSPSDHPPIASDENQAIETSDDQINDNTSECPTCTGNKIRSFAERLFNLNQQSCSAFSIVEEKPNEELIAAAKSGNLTKLRELHMQGYSLRTRDATGQIPLHYAARYGYKDIVKYIIGNAPHIINDKDINLGQTALHKAAVYRWRDICCMLVARGAKLDIADHRGNTPRLLATQNEDIDLAAYLLSQEQFQLISSDDGTSV